MMMSDANNSDNVNEPEEELDTGLINEEPLVEAAEEEIEAGGEDEVAKLRDQLLRAVAELENTRKRAEREKEQTRKFGISEFARDLLTASDNLRRALDSAPPQDDSMDDAVKNLIIGVEMTEKELLTVFEKHGIRKIDPMGEKFDYNFHQAMFELENTGEEAGTVVQVLQPGYAIADRLLRPAMVGVAKGDAGGENGQRVDTTA